MRARALVLALVAAAACGPVEYVHQVTSTASAELAAARTAAADKYAPYYYTLAVEYLRKAREEGASADFQSANRYGRLASEAARKATAQALAHGKSQDQGMAPLLPEHDDGGTP